MAQYSIKDLERLSGIKAHTIRIWEKRYGIIDPSRTDTNIRKYSDAELKKILNVSILNRYGIKISHIAAMEDEEMAEKILMISRDSSDYESLIENLIITMVELEEENFNKLLTRAIMQIGFEDTILQIVYPLKKSDCSGRPGPSTRPRNISFLTWSGRKSSLELIRLFRSGIKTPNTFFCFSRKGNFMNLACFSLTTCFRKGDIK